MKPENFTHENENESPGKHCNNYKNKDVQGSKNKKYIKALYNNQAAPDEIDADINHAFSTHFLQDSFSAGHIGINRADYRQDFDHAYHDDINELGIIMSNSKNEWFSYGDTNLDKASWHVFVDFNKIRTLSKLINVFNNNQEYSAQQFNLSNGATTEEGDIKFTSFENSTLVLNNDMLLLETHDFKKSCNKLLSELVVACDHTQVVVRSIKHKTRRDFEKHNSEPSQSDCTPVETNVDGIEVYRCKNSIIQVQKATKQNIEAWLCHQKLHSKCDYQKIIKNLMPIAYKKIISYKDTAVNLKPYVEQGITKINVDKNDAINNYQKTSFEKAYLSASTLTTRQGVPSINFGVELTRKPFSFKDTSFDISSTVEVEIYNFNENNYLNSLSMSFKSELPRPKPIFNGHIGISAVAGFGWTNIWKGGRSADFYGLYGAQANLYLGRHGIFLNALKRAGIKSNRDDGTLFQLGYSLSMLNL